METFFKNYVPRLARLTLLGGNTRITQLYFVRNVLLLCGDSEKQLPITSL